MLNIAERNARRDREEVAELIAAIGPTQVQRILDVHYTTVRRWAAGEVTPPKAVLIALRAHRGQLPGMEASKNWQGWRFDRSTDRLHGPAGEHFGPGDVRAQLIERQLIQALQREVAELKAALQRETTLNNRAANDFFNGPVTGVRLAPSPAVRSAVGRPERRRW